MLVEEVGARAVSWKNCDRSPKSDTDATSRRQTHCSSATLGICGRRKRHDIPSPGTSVLIAPAFSAADPQWRCRLGAVARVALPAPRPGAERCPYRADDVGDAHHPGADVV